MTSCKLFMEFEKKEFLFEIDYFCLEIELNQFFSVVLLQIHFGLELPGPDPE
jgi:hypothetical protein